MTEHTRRFVLDCRRLSERLRDIAAQLRQLPPLPFYGEAAAGHETLSRVADLVARSQEQLDRVGAMLDRLPRAAREVLLSSFHTVSLQSADARPSDGTAHREARLLDNGLSEVVEQLGLATTLLRNLLDSLDERREPIGKLAAELAGAADEAVMLVHELYHTYQTGWMPLRTEVEYDTRGERMGPD